MKRILPALILGLTMFAGVSGNAWARGHGGVHIGVVIGPSWGWQPYPYYYYPYPPVVYVRPPAPVQYIQQNQAAPSDYYWYYCSDPAGYYPYVKSCPAGWTKVLPRATPPR